jgi:hypothetical protein
MDGARGIITEVTLSSAEDRRVDAMGYIGSCYPYFVIFIVLGTRGILVFLIFCFGL